MIAYLAIGAAALLGWAIYGSKSNAPQTTPLQNSLTAQPYQPGQTVRAPLNQIPPGLIPAATMAVFQSVQTKGVVIQVTSVSPGVVNGQLIATYDASDSRTMMPLGGIPISVPTSAISGLA